MRRFASLGLWMAVMLWLGVMSGCASSGSSSGSGSSADGNGGQHADLVTSSDETDVDKRSRLRLELASAYFSQGQTGTALDEVKRALQANPNNVPAYNLRGLIYASLGEPGLADESFRRALQISPQDGDTLQNYGWTLCGLKRYPEAAVQFNAVLALPQWREPAKTLLAQGVCQARSGDLASAEKTLVHSYELDAANMTTALNLSEVLFRRGDLERAFFYIQRVNAVPEKANPETLWLALRIEKKRGHRSAMDELGQQLRSRFPGTRQAIAYERGQFDE
ncbi:type IV pilus biogenesis/stability protein PilW [Leptothrix ochracea]|uniref:type IV pilus biogenesis/stability protein PilW n=1 Tax=Leptothrix ochracea TaxID=735331 RepID=UPI0034E20E05